MCNRRLFIMEMLFNSVKPGPQNNCWKIRLKKKNKKTEVFLLNLLATQEEQKEMKYKLAHMSFYLYISGTSGIFMQLNV